MTEEVKSLLMLLGLIFLAPTTFGVALVAMFISNRMKETE
jgi:hypothetical protein